MRIAEHIEHLNQVITEIRTVAITSPIGIVPADLALHAQAVLREAVSNTVCDTPTPPSSP